MLAVKEALLDHCKGIVANQLQNLQESIASYQDDLGSETKSSAGDKHETGRAMLQLEMEKLGKQMLEVQKMHQVLQSINLDQHSEKIHLGSLIFTDNMNFFLSVSLGKIVFEDQTFFAVSPSAPIGKLLLGKKAKDRISFNGITSTIQKIG